MTPASTTASGGAASRIARLLDELSVTDGFPATLLLEALRIARSAAVSAWTGTSTAAGDAGLLAGLHLDLATVEIAHAARLEPGEQRADLLGGQADARARSAGRLLVDRSSWVLHDRLSAAWPAWAGCPRRWSWRCLLRRVGGMTWSYRRSKVAPKAMQRLPSRSQTWRRTSHGIGSRRRVGAPRSACSWRGYVRGVVTLFAVGVAALGTAAAIADRALDKQALSEVRGRGRRCWRRARSASTSCGPWPQFSRQ